MSYKVILMHGKDSNPSQKWYPWLKTMVIRYGMIFEAPILPSSDNPVMSDWLAELNALKPDENTILVGHSRGGVAVLRWLEAQPAERKVRSVILVAANSGLLKEVAIKSETNYGFYTDRGYDFDAIRKHCANFVVLHSRDDKWVPYDAGVKNTTGLKAKFISFENKGHFGDEVNEIPELIAEIAASSE